MSHFFANRRIVFVVCITAGVILIVCGRVILRRTPRALMSIAVDGAGTILAYSYIEAGILPHYDTISTRVSRIDDSGLETVATYTPPLRKAVVRDVAKDGRVLLSSDSGVYVYSADNAMQMVDDCNYALTARFTSERKERVVIWSPFGLKIVSPLGSQEKWELPLQAAERIAAANWTGDPLRVAVVKCSSPSSGARDPTSTSSCVLEIWDQNGVRSMQTAPVLVGIDAAWTVAINRSGERIIAYKRSRFDGNRLAVCTTVPNVTCVEIDARAVSGESDVCENISFIDDTCGLIVDSSGRLFLVDTVNLSCEYIERTGKHQDLIAATSGGALVCLSTKFGDSFELWRRGSSGMAMWMHVNIGVAPDTGHIAATVGLAVKR